MLCRNSTRSLARSTRLSASGCSLSTAMRSGGARALSRPVVRQRGARDGTEGSSCCGLYCPRKVSLLKYVTVLFKSDRKQSASILLQRQRPPLLARSSLLKSRTLHYTLYARAQTEFVSGSARAPGPKGGRQVGLDIQVQLLESIHSHGRYHVMVFVVMGNANGRV